MAVFFYLLQKYLVYMSKNLPAILMLEDGSTFLGKAFGAIGKTFGEVCFNTGMTGYQEMITDPSYNSQIITFTNPHIGNTGTNYHDQESDKDGCAGVILRNYPTLDSSWRKEKSLVDFLQIMYSHL